MISGNKDFVAEEMNVRLMADLHLIGMPSEKRMNLE